MDIRYAAYISEKYKSDDTWNYNLDIKVIPSKLNYSSDYIYNSKELAFNAGLEYAKSLGFEIFRGKNLNEDIVEIYGNEYTLSDEFYNSIASGDFSSIYVGDYFTIPIERFNVTEVISDDQVCETCGQDIPDKSTKSFEINKTEKSNITFRISHINEENDSITLTIDESIGISPINTDETITNYEDSYIKTTVLHEIYDSLYSIFKSHVEESNVNLFTKSDIFNPSRYDISESENNQLSLFALSDTYIDNNSNYWLQDTDAEGNFMYVSSDGHLNISNQNNMYSIRLKLVIS